MSKTFIPPWQDVARYPYRAIEVHTAYCRALQCPDNTPPLELREKLLAAPEEVQTQARAYMLQAVARADEMFSWAPPEYMSELDPYAPFKENAGFTDYAFWGGRGGGKSHGIAEAIIEQASEQLERVVCGREFQNSIKDSVKELLENKIKSSPHKTDWVSTETELRNKTTGSRITFVGMNRNPESAKSLEGCTIFWGEEAQTFSQDSLDIIRPTVTRTAGSRMVWSWNGREATDPIDVLFRKGELPERSYVRCVLVEDNPYFYTGRMPGEMRTAFSKFSKVKFRHIWRGAYDLRPEGLVYSDWQVGRPPLPADAEPRYGLDWGWVDPLACVEVYIVEPVDPTVARGFIYVSAEAYGARIPAKQIPDKLDKAFLGRAREYAITADSSEPKSIDDLNQAGYNTFTAKKGPGSVRAGISFIQGYDLWVDPDCVNVQSECAAYKWKVTKDGIVLRDPEDTDNHALDALRYALEDYTPPLPNGGVVYV